MNANGRECCLDDRFGWPCVQVGEVASPADRSENVVPGEEYRQLGVRLWGKGAYARESIDGADTKYKTLNRVASGDIVVNKIWARNGSVSVVQSDLDGCYVSGEFPLYSPEPGALLPDWFLLATKCRWFWHQCDELSRGTSGKNRIKPSQFLRVKIPLPPLPEQKRIVAKVQSLTSKIDEARAHRTATDKAAQVYVRVVRRQVFEGISPATVVPLENVCLTILDCLHSNPVYSDDGVPTLRSPDVGWGHLFLSTARKTSEEEYVRRTRRGEPHPGDIVLVREGGGTGKAAMVERGQRMSLGQRVMQLRPDQAQVLPRFMLAQWLSPLIQEDQIGEYTKGSASPHLNIKHIRQFRFILPSLAEQRRVISRLDGAEAAIQNMTELQELSSREMEALSPSILDRAFKGDL